MKLVCTKQDTGKRVLVDTRLELDYKDNYNDEHGNPFVSAPEPVKAKEEAPVVSEEEDELLLVCEACFKSYKTMKGLEKHLTKCNE